MRSNRLGRTASTLAVVALVAWIAVDLFGRNLFGATAWADSLVDYRLLHEHSRLVVATHAYPADYPYPPPAVVLHFATAVLPFEASAVLWAGLCGVAAVGCWLALARLLRLDWDRGAYVLLPLAHLSCAYFFQWDLRCGNCNLVFLAALLLGVYFLDRDRPATAGFWFALAFSLKLFCVLVIPYLLWKGRRCAFVWTLAFVAAFWLVLPALAFGCGDFGEVYGAWLDRLTHAVGRSADHHHPILTSLPRAADFLAGDNGPLIVNGVRGLWLALGLLGWRASARRPRDDAFGLLGDVALLTLAPIAVSPYLEPYHPVPFAIPALLLLRTAVGRERWHLRLLATVTFVAALVVAKLPLHWELRGLLLNAKLLLAVSGVVLVAWLRSGVVSGTIGQGRRRRLFEFLGRLMERRPDAPARRFPLTPARRAVAPEGALIPAGGSANGGCSGRSPARPSTCR